MSYASEVLADSPLMFWRLQETSGTNADDATANNRDGTYGGTTGLNQTPAPLYTDSASRSARTFATSGSCINISFASWMTVTTAVSMECWVRFTGTGTTGIFPFSRTGGSAYNCGILVTASGRVGFGTNGAASGSALTADALWNDGHWHHVVGTYDGTTTRVYVDGKLEATAATVSGSLDSTANGLQVGGRGADYFSGYVAEPAYYNTVLSAARIKAHYLAGMATAGSWTHPTGPRVVAIDDKVYVGSITQAMQVVVDEYDAAAGTFVDRHVVASRVSPFDDHNGPALIMRAGEPPVVLWTKHSTTSNLHYTVGTQDIELGFTAGSEQTKAMGAATTYVTGHVNGTDLYAVVRAHSSGLEWYLVKSTDGGATWGTPKKLMSDANQCYITSRMVGGVLRMAATRHPRETGGQSVYYAELNLATDALTNRAGGSIGTIGASAPAMTSWEVAAAPTSGYKTWVYDIGPGATREIVWAQMSTHDLPANTSYLFTSDGSGSWATNTVVAAGTTFALEATADNGGAALGGAQMPEEGVVFLSREASTTWHIERWTTADDGATWDDVSVSTSSTERLVRPWRAESVDGTADGWVGINRVTAPFNSYLDHLSQIGLTAEPAPSVDLTGAATTVNPTAAGSLTGMNASSLTGAATTVNPSSAAVMSAAESVINGAATTVNPTSAALFNSTAGVGITGAATTVDPTVAGSLLAELVADLTGAATTVNPTVAGTLTATLVAELSGAATTENPTSAGLIEDVADGFTCLDLATDVTVVFGELVGGEVTTGSAIGPEIILSEPTLEYGKTYEIRVSYDGGDLDTPVYMFAVDSFTDPDPNYLDLGIHEGPHDATTVFTVGSGVGYYDTAIAEGWTFLDISGPTGTTITAVCWRDVTPAEAEEATAVEDDAETVEDPPVDEEAFAAEWSVFPAVGTLPPVQPMDLDVARVYTSVSMSGTQVVFNGLTRVEKPRERDRLVAGDTDITTVNGVRTPTPDFTLIEPGTYGPATLTVPGINPLFHVIDDIDWLEKGTRLVVQRVNAAGAATATDYRGRIQSWDLTGDKLTVSVGGLLAGKAAVRDRQQPPIRRRRDVEYWVRAAARKLRVPLAGDDCGKRVTSWGNVNYWDYMTQMVTLAQRQDGRQWTFHYDEDNSKFVFAEKDRTTIRGTLYFTDKAPVFDGRCDFTQMPDEVFIDATAPNGFKTERLSIPGLQGYDAIPLFPGPIEEGAIVSPDVEKMIFQLIVWGYLARDDVAGGVDQDVLDAVSEFQVENGDDPTGVLDEDQWERLFTLANGGAFTMKEARRLPDGERRPIRRFNRGADGQERDTNPYFDESQLRLVVSETNSIGHGFTGQQVRKFAKGRLWDGNPQWSGTVDLGSPGGFAIIAGNHTPGTAVDADDIMPARAIRPGMNLRAPLFQGGTTFHVSGVEVSGDGRAVQLTLDTEFRDSRPAWEIVQQHRENKRNPNKAFMESQSSRIPNDKIYGALKSHGLVRPGYEVKCNVWTTFPVFVGEAGTVRKFAIRVVQGLNPAFAVGVFGTKPPGAALAPRPFANDAKQQWQERQSARDDANELALWGDDDAPAGYWPKTKGDPGAVPTGDFVDNGGFDFYVHEEPVLWVAIYAHVPADDVPESGVAGKIAPGRMFWVVPPDN